MVSNFFKTIFKSHFTKAKHVERHCVSKFVLQINMPCCVSLSVCCSASLVLILNRSLFHFRCWLSSDFPQLRLVYYITTVTIPSSVVLCNCCLLVLVVFKLRRLRREGGSSWRSMCKDRGSQLVKDCTTVLGLSCVLGLTWGFTSTTYVSIPGIYIFTVLNSLQGWSILATPIHPTVKCQISFVIC